MDNNIVLKIKDSVDLFLTDDFLLTVYYMNTRVRKTFKVNRLTISLLEAIDGKSNLYELSAIINLQPSDIKILIKALLHHRIITPVYNKNNKAVSARYSRQLNYFSEFFETEEEGYLAQEKLSKYKILVLGCGGVGSTIAIQLAMAGIKNFILFDDNIVRNSDISRHLFFREKNIGLHKTEALGLFLKDIDKDIKVECLNQYLEPNTKIDHLIMDSDFIINTLDEPYIGYTAAKISRVCVKHKKAHYIAGGFDAHLASTGELIIPGVTPCVECYAMYFKEKLKGWKPKKHPVVARSAELGGLSSLSLFSASFASIEIIKYLLSLVPMEDSYKVRGEFLFDTMELTYLNVQKNKLCPVCGEKDDV